MLNIDEVVSRLENNSPTCERDLLRDCKLPLKFLGDGAYRHAYQIIGTQTVVKLPNIQTYDYNGKEEVSYNVKHARHELDSIHSINRKNSKFKFLKPYLPDIYYSSYTSGLVYMKKYNSIGSRKHRRTIEELETRCREIGGTDYSDIDNGGNFGLDKEGNIRLIDFGCFNGGC